MQGALQSGRRPVRRPKATRVFKTGRGREFCADDERAPTRRIAAAHAEGHGAQGIDTEFAEPLDGTPFVLRSEHRQAQRDKVLDDLGAAYAAMDLDEVAAPGDFGAQGPAPLQLAEDLAIERLGELGVDTPVSYTHLDVYKRQKRRWKAKVRVDGSLDCDGQPAGSIHKVGAGVQGAPSCNGWTFWHVDNGKELRVIDAVRQDWLLANEA